MTRPFRKALHRVGWGLLTAGALTSVRTASAQTTYVPQGVISSATAEVWEAKGPSLSEEAARLAEMRTEVAWLANPLTYPCRLEARVVGARMQVIGYVPSEGVRGYALELARSATGLWVVDNLTVNPEIALPCEPRGNEEILQRSAASALQMLLPSYANDFTVNVWASGQVVIQGNVPCYEYKHAASHCLHHLSGCTSVINQLQIVPVTEARRPAAVQPAPLPPVEPRSETAHPVAFVAPAETYVPAAPSRMVTSSPQDVSLPPARVVTNSLQDAPLPPARLITTSPQYVPPAPARVVTSSPMLTDRWSGAQGTSVASVDSRSETPLPRPAAVTSSPYRPWPESAPIRPVHYDVPASRLTSAKPQPPAAPTSGYITSGFVIFDAADSGADQAGLQALQRRLQQSIATSCGRPNQEIEITATSGSTLQVRIRAHSAREGEALASKILALSELAPYQVSLDVALAP
jgi:hypothetical protein